MFLFSENPPEYFFKKTDDYDHMHSRNCKNMAHSAFAEDVGDFTFKFAPGSDKKLFGKSGVPSDKIFVNYRRDLLADEMDIVSQGMIFPAGYFNGRILVCIKRNSSGTVCKKISDGVLDSF